MPMHRPLAIVTGASSGIGLELARLCAQDGYDLLVAADRPIAADALDALRAQGADVDAVEADLAKPDGVERLLAAAKGRPVEALLANAGHGLGHAFLDQDFAEVKHLIDTNITGTLQLIHTVGREMRQRGHGRVLVTGSIAGYMPGAFQAAYNASKAFVDSFAGALREELAGTGVSVTLLMPGATETDFFDRAGLQDTKIGQSPKDDPAFVAKVGYEAMKRGEGAVISGFKNKVQAAFANFAPGALTAHQHRKMAEPGTGRPQRGQGGGGGTGPMLLGLAAAAALLALSGPGRRQVRRAGTAMRTAARARVPS